MFMYFYIVEYICSYHVCIHTGNKKKKNKEEFKFDRFYIIIEFTVSYCKKFYDFFSLYCPSQLYKKKKKKKS